MNIFAAIIFIQNFTKCLTIFLCKIMFTNSSLHFSHLRIETISFLLMVLGFASSANLKKRKQGNISFKVSLETNLYPYTSINSSKTNG